MRTAPAHRPAPARRADASAAMSALATALVRLRDAPTVDHVVPRIAREGLTLGFSRVMVTSLDRGRLRQLVCRVRDDAAPGAAVAQAASSDGVTLEAPWTETDAVRRGRARHVRAADHRPCRCLAFSGSASYVVAPLVVQDLTVGLIHADRHLDAADVDAFDRDLLGAFAASAGAELWRATLLDREQQLQHRACALAAGLAGVFDLPLAPPALRAPDTALAAVRVAEPSQRLEGVLTGRECDVAALVSRGLTNAEIAERLVISQGTVKSHVKHILRKLRARNRVEAARKYLALSELPAMPADR